MGRVTAIVQCRVNSTRLPRKCFADIDGMPAVVRLLNNLTLCERLDDIVLAVPEGDYELIRLADDMHVNCYAGSEHDVLSRYAEAAWMFKADVIVRITADCPLLDPALVDDAIRRYRGQGYFHVSGYPRGCGDIELMAREALDKANKIEPKRSPRRQHVWQAVEGVSENIAFEPCPLPLRRPSYRVCLDEPADLTAINMVLQMLDHPKTPSVADIVWVLDRNPSIRKVNEKVRQVS